MPSLKLSLAFVASALLAAIPVNAGRHSELNRQRWMRKQTKMADVTPEPESAYRYLNSKTAPFRVKSLPDVDMDIGEMYSGLMPIDTANPDRALFFVWQPTIGDKVDEVTIWLNGGPGCSSLLGFFQEMGRFTWQPGTYKPVQNYYSWVNSTNMLWVEQPVGTGFATGKITAKTQEETAQDFIKFFKNFQKTFGIKNYKIYVTGESYAGRYVPYISAAMLDEKDKEYYNLSGALVYDPCIGSFDYTNQVTIGPFVKENANLFNFNGHVQKRLDHKYEHCGYREYGEKYLTYPPPGKQPPQYFNYSSEVNCDMFDLVYGQALQVNPCFDIYEINQNCPFLSDVLSFPTGFSDVTYPTYFNRADVKKAMHAPLDVTWMPCSNKQVFIGGPKENGRHTGGPQGEGDLSADPIQKVLPQVIEATNRVLVSHGSYDMVLVPDGTLLAIQNMTWNGKRGFQTKPHVTFRVPYHDLQNAEVYHENGLDIFSTLPQRVMGIQHVERGLAWVQTFQSGHMQPEFQPRAAYRHLQWLLGRIDTL